MGVVGSLGQEEGIDPVSAQGSHSPHAPETVVHYKKIQTYKYTKIHRYKYTKYTLFSRNPLTIFLLSAAT